MGVPQARWMVDFMENPMKIRMMNRGSPVESEMGMSMGGVPETSTMEISW